MATNNGTKDRIIRLRIAHYKMEEKTEEEAHKFGTSFATKAAAIHAKHGIEAYAQVRYGLSLLLICYIGAN
jgi:hypothetical protein